MSQKKKGRQVPAFLIFSGLRRRIAAAVRPITRV
jgi:hypothetical protein